MPKVIADTTVLEAALTTLLNHGYDGATTRLIAAAAQMNEVTLFRKFGSKDRLIALAVQQELAAFDTAQIGYSGDLQADLVAIVQFYAAFFQQRARLIPLIISEVPRRPELRAGLIELGTIVDRLHITITRYQASGALRAGPPFQLLAALIAPVLAHYLIEQLFPLDQPFAAASHTQAFLQGYATTSQ